MQSIKAVCFSFCFLVSPSLWADDLLNQSINSGGGWVSNSENSSFTVYGEVYQSAQVDIQSPTHTVDLNTSVSLEMIWVEPGTFMMGSPESEVGRGNDETQHEVTLTKGFYLGKYEVTQAQYEAVMTGNDKGLSPKPSYFNGYPNRPVEQVSWNDVQVFLERLNEQAADSIPAGWAYVLPTEAQWEYACRAGTTTSYSWGDIINPSNANYSSSQTVNVGLYSANPWGFFDMHGNLWEWTTDWGGIYSSDAQIDPKGSASGSNRIYRGGAWSHIGKYLRSAERFYFEPTPQQVGFRLVFRQINGSPANLNSVAELSVSENQPIGTIVGEFNATDPDGNNSLITFHLVSGEGDGNNSLFTLDTNGTLKTATIFDYENNASTYTIRVQAKDELNATVEGNFTVTLTDIFEDMDGDGIEDHLDDDMDGDGFSNEHEAETGSDPQDRQSNPLNYGLIAWYPFDGNASDMSGIGNDGTVYGATLGEDRNGEMGNAYQFDGVDDFIEVYDHPSLKPSSAISLSVWTKYVEREGRWYDRIISKNSPHPELGPGSYQIIAGGLPDNIGYGEIGFYITTNQSTSWIGYRDKVVSKDTNLGANQWHHISATWAHGVAKVFHNSELVYQATNEGTLSHTDSSLFFGKDEEGGNFWKGSIDDIRIYDRALSESEVRVLYDIEKPSVQSPTHTVDLNTSVSLEMIWVEPGTFTMGQSGVAEPEHNVTLTQGFYLGKYEVTQAQYEAVMSGNTDGLSATPSGYANHPNRAVEQVSWNDVQVFLKRLNEQAADSIPAGWAYVLPTEAQWEYACRAGTTTTYSWGDTITSENANYAQQVGQPSTVGNYAANPWGFFDMHGNVWEWTADALHSYSTDAQTNPYHAGLTNSNRMVRGGTWNDTAEKLASSFRNSDYPDNGADNRGFRLALKQVNQAPIELNSTAPLTLAENQPVGTVVGEFNATDPEGDEIAYSLISGEGDGGNLLFILDQNGMLLSAAIFDYETNASNYSIRVQARDQHNATTEKQFTVSLLDLDDEKPVLVLMGDSNVTHEAGNEYVDAHARWTDNIDGEGTVVGVGEVNSSIPGIYTVVYQFTDQAGNQAIPVNRTVTVVDTTAPVITLLGDENTTHLIGMEYTDQGAVWSDLVDGNGTADAIGTVDVNVPGIYEISYSYTDSMGNQASPVVRTITVIDSEAPVLSLLGFTNHIHEAGREYTDQGAVWNDLVDGNGTVDGVGTVDINVLGSYTLTYNFTDSSGNQADPLTRTVTVVDTTSPVITLIGDTNLTLEGGGEYIDLGAVWNDLVDGNGTVEGIGAVDVNAPGVYEITYSYIDSSGNQASPVVRTIEIMNGMPRDLNSTSALSITENQPIGTLVGEFIAVDPEGGALSFHLVNGIDDNNNSLFTLDPSGTLKTAAVFDYEVVSSLKIGVQARDEYNATAEEIFTVSVMDIYEPRPNHTAELNSTVSLEMIWVEPGTFTMGSPETEAGRKNDAGRETQHEVTLTQGFYLGKYEVTQAQYEAVMTGNDDGLNATPSNWPNNPGRPVEMVSWEDIQKFLIRLNTQQAGNIPEGWAYVLPTEAQWEYACRAGTTTAYSWGDNISATDANWNHGNDASQTEDVGQYSANPWGFFDMHGNVWEWTADAYASIATGAQTDPFNVGTTGSSRVARGGSWGTTGLDLRSAYRNLNNEGPSYRSIRLGFRLGFQQIEEVDMVSPELELFGGIEIPHKLGEPWVEPGFAASDERDGNLTNSVTISGSVDVDTEATNILTYSVSDTSGNEATATRTVTVGNFPVNGFSPVEQALYPGKFEELMVELVEINPENPVSLGFPDFPKLDVSIDDFLIATHEVTFNLWTKVRIAAFEKLNWNLREGDQGSHPDVTNPMHPVTNLSLPEMTLWCNAFSLLIGADPCYFIEDDDGAMDVLSPDNLRNEIHFEPDANGVRLPNGNEWEYAARGGMIDQPFPWGNDSPWGRANWVIFQGEPNSTTPVGNYEPNGYGLFDMAGNVGERIWDTALEPNATIPLVLTTKHVTKGDAWNFGWQPKVTHGWVVNQGHRGGSDGFRIARNFEVGSNNPENRPPLNLRSLADLSILENQPIGTQVGQFTAEDPDGDDLTFHFVSGENNNSLFTLDRNGSLKAARTFDFEVDGPSFTIEVEARDPSGMSVAGEFEVSLADEIENSAPFNLRASGELSVMENQPSGTQVGQFTAEDPDGDALTFHFVSGDNNNSLFTLDTNGTLSTARSFDFEVDGASFTIEVEARDPSEASVSGEFVVTLIDDPEGEVRLVVKNFVSLGFSGRIGTLEVQGMQGLTFQLGPDEFGNLHHFTLSKDGKLTLEEELWESGTHTLNILIFDGEELVAEPQITIEVDAPEREDFLAADTTDPAYHESALMIRDLDVVQHDWRNGHNPIKTIGSIEGRDGLFVTTAQPHGRKEGDSVVLSGVKGLQIEGLKNWNFLIDEVNATSFRIRHFGKNANGVHDGSLGKLARAVVGTTYQTSPSDFLLGPWTFGHLLGNMVGEQDDPMTFYKHFANQWKNKQIVNGWATDKRPETHRSMVPEGIDELTLSNLPFRLLSIGNRLDLFHAKSIGDIADAGEGRFVFTMTRPFELPFEEENIWKVHQQSPADQRMFTLIFEYGQPARDFATLSKWAKDWHKLEQVSKDFSPSENYLEQLNDLTDRFTKRGANPFRPNGNPINQVRTNDFIGFTLWQMREFNLFSRDAAHNVKASPDRKTLLKVDDELSSIDVGIWTTTTKNNPMVGGNHVHPSLEGALSRWINQKESQILDGEVGPRAPEWMEGPVANEPGGFTYQFESGSVRTNLARYKFSLSTCSGCHTGDTATGFQMVVSNGQRQKARFAPFMEGNRLGGSHQVNDGVDRDKKHEFFDLKAREDIVRDILTIAEQVDAARLRLNRTEVDPLQMSQALAQVFVSGGIIGDWEYSLPAGRKDNEFFSLNSSTGDLSLASSLNQPPLGSLQLFVRATATDGTGVVLERPYSLWILSEGELQLTEDLDPSVQPNDPPPMVTPRPNRTH